MNGNLTRCAWRRRPSLFLGSRAPSAARASPSAAPQLAALIIGERHLGLWSGRLHPRVQGPHADPQIARNADAAALRCRGRGEWLPREILVSTRRDVGPSGTPSRILRYKRCPRKRAKASVLLATGCWLLVPSAGNRPERDQQIESRLAHRILGLRHRGLEVARRALRVDHLDVGGRRRRRTRRS